MKIINIPRYIILIALLAFSTAAFAQTYGQPTVVEKDAFLEVLNAIDIVPTRQSLVANFPKAAARLELAGCDPKTNAYARHRAISLLSMFKDEGKAALTRLMSCPIPETQERTIYTLARAFSHDKTVIQSVLDFNHLDSKTSALWSIRALRWISPEIAKPKLLEILKSDHVKAKKLARRILEK